MNKKFILALCILAIGLTGCRGQLKEETHKIENIEISNEYVQEYYDTIVHIISCDDIEDIDRKKYSLISDSLYESIEDNYNANNESTINEKDLDGLDGPDIDTDERSITIDGKYPIVDDYGTIYKYGTKEESDKSYERFDGLSKYELLSYKIIGSNLRLKIFMREFKVTQSYILSIDPENKQIISYGGV